MKESFFWLTNLSKMRVSLADLNLTIKPYATINLLDKKHYHYTEKELIESARSGSIFKKRKILSVRSVAPEEIKNKIKISTESTIISRERSVLNIKEEFYEELNVSDELFAEQNADIAEMDTKK